MIELTASEVRTLVETRDLLRAKYESERDVRVSRTHAAVMDVLQHAVLSYDDDIEL